MWANRTSFFMVFLIIALIILIFIWGPAEILNGANLDDKKNIAVEFHGMVFDIVLFGVILTIYESITNRSATIQRLNEEIDDYRGWDEKEAMYRITGITKRLLNRKYFKINLNSCFLSKSKIDNLKLIKGSCNRTNFSKSMLFCANFYETDLQNANFENCLLAHCRIVKSNISGAKFKSTNLVEAIIEDCKAGNTNFNGADLRKIQFINTNLDWIQISECKVERKDWIENLVKNNNKGVEVLAKKYYVEDKIYEDPLKISYYLIKRKKNIPKQILDQEVRFKDRCTAMTKEGERCKNIAKIGFDKCSIHYKNK